MTTGPTSAAGKPVSVSGPTFSDRLSLAGRDIGSFLQSQVPKSCPAKCALGVVAVVMFPVTVPFSVGFVAGGMVRLFFAQHRIEAQILRSAGGGSVVTPAVRAQVFTILKEAKTVEERSKKAAILQEVLSRCSGDTLQSNLTCFAATDAKTAEPICVVMRRANCDFETAQYIHKLLKGCSESVRGSILDAVNGRENKKELTEALFQLAIKLAPAEREKIKELYASKEVQALLAQTDPLKRQTVMQLLVAGPVMSKDTLCAELASCLGYEGNVNELTKIMQRLGCGIETGRQIQKALSPLTDNQKVFALMLLKNCGGGVNEAKHICQQLQKCNADPVSLDMRFDTMKQFNAWISLLTRGDLKPVPNSAAEMRAIYLMAVSDMSATGAYNELASKDLNLLNSAESVAEVQCREQIKDFDFTKIRLPYDSKMRRELFENIEGFVDSTLLDAEDKKTIRTEIFRAMSRGEDGLGATGNWHELLKKHGIDGCKQICANIRKAEKVDVLAVQVVVLAAFKGGPQEVQRIVDKVIYLSDRQPAQREMILQAMIAVGKNPPPEKGWIDAVLGVFDKGLQMIIYSPNRDKISLDELNKIRAHCVREVQAVSLASGDTFRQGGAVIGNTYGGMDDQTTCDYAKLSGDKRTLQVVDGVGHNSAETRGREYPIYDQMLAKVLERPTTYPAPTPPDTKEKTLNEHKAALKAIGEEYGPQTGEMSKPAGVIAQFVTIGADTHLVTAQYADTCFVVLHPAPDGKYQYEFKEHVKGSGGLGEKADISTQPVKPGAVVFAFTDGIGEFLTQSEIIQVLQAHKPGGDLKQEFIDKIKNMAQSKDSTRVQACDTAVRCKLWDSTDPNCYDDIGFAFMSVPGGT